MVVATLFAGCLLPVEEIECTKDSECAPWLACVERRCTARVDGGARTDAGVTTVIDAGTTCADASARTSWGNAAGELSGVQLGGGTTPLPQLTRALSVTRNGDVRFTIVSAQLNRAAANDETGYVAIRVKNTSSTAACFAKADSVTYLGANSQIVFMDTVGTYMNGSVATSISSQVTTDTCLQPGEEGFLIAIVLDRDVPNFFSNTTGVRLRMSASTSMFEREPSAFLPRSYTSTAMSFGAMVSVVARNEGPGLIAADRSGPLALMIPLDTEGRGLKWSFLGAPSSGVLKLRPCETTTLSDLFLFDGATSRAYFHVGEFSDCTGCARTLDLSTPEGLEAFLVRRNEAQDAKRVLAP